MSLDPREPDDVAYVKDLLQVAFLILAGIWLVHSLATGSGGEVKRAVAAS